MDELKDLVVKSLEHRKILGGIRAKLRTEILKVIQDEQKSSNQKVISNSGAFEDIMASEVQKEGLAIVFNFLSQFKLEYSAKVLLSELNMTNVEILPKIESSKCELESILKGGNTKRKTSPIPDSKTTGNKTKLEPIKELNNKTKLDPINVKKTSFNDINLDSIEKDSPAPSNKVNSGNKSNLNQNKKDHSSNKKSDQDFDFEEVDEEIEGDIFGGSNENLNLSESKDKQSISQSGAFTESQGADGSVDSTILEGFDQVENVVKPRKI